MKLKISLLVLVMAIAGFGGWRWWSQQQAAKLVYKEEKVRRGDLSVMVLATGLVQPENRLEIKPPIAGRVETLLTVEGARVKKGQILAWMSSTERAALLDAAMAKGPEEYKKWQELYNPTPILAPIDGMIILKNVESGQTFSTQDAIMVMSNRLTVKAQLDETDISKIQIHQKAVVTLDAYPDSPLPGKVGKIAFDAKTVNNVTTYIVDVIPDEVPHFMLSGMTANVSFSISSQKDALYLSAEALKAKDGKFYVLTPNPTDKEKPSEVEIKTGLTDGKKIEILSGLNEGDVILFNEFKLESKKNGGGSPFSPMGGRPRGK